MRSLAGRQNTPRPCRDRSHRTRALLEASLPLLSSYPCGQLATSRQSSRSLSSLLLFSVRQSFSDYMKNQYEAFRLLYYFRVGAHLAPAPFVRLSGVSDGPCDI